MALRFDVQRLADFLGDGDHSFGGYRTDVFTHGVVGRGSEGGGVVHCLPSYRLENDFSRGSFLARWVELDAFVQHIEIRMKKSIQKRSF